MSLIHLLAYGLIVAAVECVAYIKHTLFLTDYKCCGKSGFSEKIEAEFAGGAEVAEEEESQ